MTTNKLRAALTAALLGTAMAIGAMDVFTIPAAAAISAAVGTPLKEAQALAAAGNYKGAMAKVNEAEAVSGKTPEETQTISQMKSYIGVKSGDSSIGGAAGAKAKFANDYAAKKYADVIADADLLKKAGALDTSAMQVIAQAYYLSGNKKGCISYIKGTLGNAGGDATQMLLMRCAYDAGDDVTQRQALETLVSHSGKAEYWSDLLKLSERSKGMADHDTLDIYRLKMLTGTITGKDEYTLLAQLSVQMGFAAEAQAVVEKGQAAKVLNDDRSTRLLTLAKTQSAAKAASMDKDLAAAKAAPNGDALVKIGEAQWGMGKAADAVTTLQAALAKPVTDKLDAQLRLGMAQYSAGQKPASTKTFDAVKGPDTDKTVMIAHLWSLYSKK